MKVGGGEGLEKTLERREGGNLKEGGRGAHTHYNKNRTPESDGSKDAQQCHTHSNEPSNYTEDGP